MGVVGVEGKGADACGPGGEPHPRSPGVVRLAERLGGLVVISERERRRIAHRPCAVIDVRPPLRDGQRRVWRGARGVGEDCNGDGTAAIDAVSAQFNWSLSTIRSIAAEMRAAAGASPREGGTAAAGWDACRTALRARLDLLAQRIDSTITLDDLVLPEAEGRSLRAVAAEMRPRATVYER